MKTTYFLGFIALFSLTLWGCNNSQQVVPDTTTASARLSGDTTGFYCKKNITKIAVTDLPATITSAISASYAGATIDYAAKDDAGNFLVALTQNSTRTTLLFNADGTFNKELALRDGPGGGKGPGGHGPGGHGRDSLSQVAVADLPAAITSAISASYAGSTINSAGKDATRGYIVMITLADGTTRKALLFNIDGTFAQEVVRGIKGNYSVIDAATLPAPITSYISTNYAGSTIKVAGKNPTGQFKVIIQQSNNQLAELTFATDGTFIQVQKGRH
ncbi:PepSY-like domain-containing protein [Fibrella arboris]|uniref:PepSY-like domain-containing protein n=1 Tax=Fibrella arboris TaxID=3242486 RepID=UPI0035209630